MNSKHHKLFGILMLLLGLVASHMALAQDVKVTGAAPGAAPPATYGLDVIISGAGFDKSAKVKFLKSSTGKPADIIVNRSEVNGSTQITVNIDVSDTATDQDQYDIEVKMSRGRGGKGTTLFTVESKSGSGGHAGAPGPMICIVNALEDVDATVGNDGDSVYMDGEDKVQCRSGDVVYPNLAGLRVRTLENGNIRKAKRFLDLSFGTCIDPSGASDCGLPPELLNLSNDTVDLAVRAYHDDSDANHIYLMPKGQTHAMPISFYPKGLDAYYRITMMKGEEPTRFPCYFNPDYPSDEIDDINVYIWQDGEFSGEPEDEWPDGYTVTTGVVNELSEGESEFPTVELATAQAVICSNKSATGAACPAGYNKDDYCYVRGVVPVRFTMHMIYQ